VIVVVVAAVVAVVLCVVAGWAVAVDRAVTLVTRARVESADLPEGRRKRSLALLRRPALTSGSLQLVAMAALVAAGVLVAVALPVEDDRWRLLAIPVVVLAGFAVARTTGDLAGRRGSLVLLTASSGAALVVVRTVQPFASVVSRLAGRGRSVPEEGGDDMADESNTELRELLDRASGGEMIEDAEARLIHSVFEFGDTIVREVMTPRTDIVALEQTATVQDAFARAVETGFSRMPVYGRDLDDIVGLLYVKDLMSSVLRDRVEEQLAETDGIDVYMRSVKVVPEQKRTAELLTEMRLENYHLAVVVDEYGGTAGLVSLEDLLEELVGEIRDEYDPHDELIVPLDGGGWRANGRLALSDLGDHIGREVEIEDADTVGGAVMALLGRVPDPGDAAVDDASGVRFTAVTVDGRRITEVDVAVLARGGDSGGAGHDSDGETDGDVPTPADPSLRQAQ
jgi:CBS domain containing-hemolysin-like protein